MIKTFLIAIILGAALNVTAQMAITVPAEYEKNDGVILTWPYSPSLDSVIAEISGLAAASGEVWLLYNPDSVVTDTNDIRTFLMATGNNFDNIGFVPAYTNTFFIREYGPVTGYGVFDQTLVRYFGDPLFDGYSRPQDDSVPHQLANFWQADYVQYNLAFESGNIVTDGEKNLFASTGLLQENLPLSEQEVSARISAIYNVSNVTFLTAPEHSGGGAMKSLDMFVKLLDSETILITEIPDTLPDYFLIENNVQTIQNLTNTYEAPYKIVRVMAAPLDNGKYDTTLSGELRSYTNALILNNLILIPSYGNSEYDSAAYYVYKNNTYGMTVKMVDARRLSLLHAAVHTVTRERPQTHYLRINHKKVEGAQEYQGEEFTIHCLASGDDVIDNMWLHYRFNHDTTWQKTMVHLVCPTHYGIIENVQLTDTIHYYLDATEINGTTITYPLSAPDGYFTFWFDVTGINSNETFRLKPAIYPNPVLNYVKVSNLPVNKEVNYQIVDLSGKAFQSGRVNAGGSIKLADNLTPGMYVLNLQVGNRIENIKFIKR